MKKVVNILRVDEDSFKVSYLIERRPAKPWVIFLHGLQSTSDAFLPIMTSHEFDGYSLLALDFVGFGDSEVDSQNFSFDLKAQARVLGALIDLEGIQECSLVGHSMGGMIAILYAQDKPDIRALVNMEGNLRDEDSGASKEIAAMEHSNFLGNYFPKLLRDLQSSDRQSSKLRLRGLEKANPLAIFKSAISIASYAKSGIVFDAFLALDTHAFLIRGEKSNFLPLPKGLDIEEIIIPNASHFMFMEEVEVTKDAISKILSTSCEK